MIAEEEEQLVRLQRAATLASEGAFAEAVELLQGPMSGAFGALEGSIRSLIADYKLAIEQNALSIEEFTASKRELERKIVMIEEQSETIQRLSAPIIDVWDDVVTVPLTGNPDRRHTQEIAERLLARIQSARIAWVIIDLTGTPQIGTTLAGQIVKLSQAIRLMGAECLVTGIGAEVAQTLASLADSLGGLRSIATLKEGLKYCLLRQRSAGSRGR